MGRLSEKIKSAAPKRRKLAGLERRWLVNNVSVMVVLAALCVAAITLSLGAYYYSNVRSGLEAKAKTTTDFFSNYISQSYNEYYQSCIQFAQTFEEKDRLELQFITPDGRMVASSYGEFAGKSPQTPDIQEAVTTGKLARFQGKDPDTHERILAVSSPMVYSNGEVIGVLRYVTGLKNVDRQILMIGLIALTAGLIFIASMFFISSFFIRLLSNPSSGQVSYPSAAMAIMNVWAARAQDLLTVTRISHSETSRITTMKSASLPTRSTTCPSKSGSRKRRSRSSCRRFPTSCARRLRRFPAGARRCFPPAI